MRDVTQARLVGGRYELDGVVGRGGMAEVYRARDIRLGRVVAVKTLRDDLARDQSIRARFRREAQSAASLNHPSIVAVYDSGQDMDGDIAVPYIVMEYVDGRTLADLLDDDRRLRPERAAEIADGVLGALEVSHRNGVVHRDIKPANVMLTRSCDVKVMDFGIARSLGGSQITITRTAQVVGTAQYMSPEQARGERVDARSDLYSTGCLLYELLTGRPPFTGDSPVAIAYQHARENPVPPSQADPDVPRWADAITLKAMAKNPADRYQTAAEMRAGIRRAMPGMPVSPSARPVLPLLTEGVQQAQRAGDAATAAPPSRAIPGYRDSNRAQRPAGGRRRRAVLWALSGLLVVLAAVVAVAYLTPAGGGTTTKTYPTPQVTGLSYKMASQEIKEAHLRPQRINKTSQAVRKNHVISTDPLHGTTLAANSTVKVYVSAGQQQVTVPNVIGEDVNTARARLTRAGLNPAVRTDGTSTAPASTVLQQRPSAGAQVHPGSVETIWAAAASVKVQDVRGDPAETARNTLDEQGFNVHVVEQSGPSSAAAGMVYAQTPPGGTPLAQGATVTIYVQHKPPPPPGIAVAPATLPVTQGSTGTFGVTLSKAPTAPVTVTVSMTSGNAGLSVSSSGTLTFTPSNWNTAQNVTITADSSSTGSATFAASAAGYATATVTVTETAGRGGG
jgi:serine/threonine-protein kinase